MTDALKPNDKPWWFPNRAPGGSDPETGRPYTYTHDNLHDALDQLDALSNAYLALLTAPQPGKAEGDGWVDLRTTTIDPSTSHGWVYTDSGQMFTAMRSGEEWVWIPLGPLGEAPDRYPHIKNVTHWRPLAHALQHARTPNVVAPAPPVAPGMLTEQDVAEIEASLATKYGIAPPVEPGRG